MLCCVVIICNLCSSLSPLNLKTSPPAVRVKAERVWIVSARLLLNKQRATDCDQSDSTQTRQRNISYAVCCTDIHVTEQFVATFTTGILLLWNYSIVSSVQLDDYYCDVEVSTFGVPCRRLHFALKHITNGRLVGTLWHTRGVYPGVSYVKTTVCCHANDRSIKMAAGVERASQLSRWFSHSRLCIGYYV